MKKKVYSKPEIIHTEKLEARAAACDKLSDAACPGGVIIT